MPSVINYHANIYNALKLLIVFIFAQIKGVLLQICVMLNMYSEINILKHGRSNVRKIGT